MVAFLGKKKWEGTGYGCIGKSGKVLFTVAFLGRKKWESTG